MIIPILKFCHRSTLVAIEIVAGILLLLLGVMCILFWKLSQGPIDVTFAADSVKKVIVSSEHQTDLQFDSIVAEWPEFTGPISIGLSGVRLIENEKPVLNIPQLGIRIAKAPLLIGMVKPEAVIAKNATLKLYRAKNGGVHLLLSDTAEIEKQPEQDAPTSEAEFKDIGEALFKGGNLPDYPAIQPLSQMEHFSVKNAHVIIVDDETGKGWNIPDLDMELHRKDNAFTIEATYKEGTSDTTRLLFEMERNEDSKDVSFQAKMDNINASTLAQLFLPVKLTHDPQFILMGNISGQMDSDWNLKKLDSNIESEQGTINLDGLYETPLKFSKLATQISYDKGSNKIILHDTHIDINNSTLSLEGEKLAGADDSVFALHIKIAETSFDEIQSLWPDNQKDTLAADWLTKRLSDAKITNLDVMIPINVTLPEDTDTTRLEASFDFENLTADYRAPLIPVKEAKGKATLKNDVLSIAVDSGKLADMSIQGGTVEITHLTHPTTVGEVTIKANASGNIGTVLGYISLEPISLGEKVGINPATVKGTTSLTAEVTFPALKELPKEEVRVVVDAKLNDVRIPSIVRGMDLTGGPYDLSVKAGAVTLSGKGALGGQPIDLTYTEYINPDEAPYLSAVKADVVADKALREKFGVHLDQFVEGDVPVKIDYKQTKNKDEEISIVADATPAVLKFSPFKYKKKVGQGASATCNVLIQKGEVRKISDLKIAIDKGGKAEGNIVFGKVGKDNDVKSGKFSSFTMAGANNFALDFTQTAPDVFDITIKGKQLDARPFLSNGGDKGSKSDDNTAVTAKVDVTLIKTGDKPEQMLTKPALSLKTNSEGDVSFLDLKGQVKGGTLSVSLKPDSNGQTQLSIISNNAGSALDTLDIYNQMVGGTLYVQGSQIKGGGINDIVGQGQISDFTVVKAPILAKLINLFSLSGLTELLQNKGIEFKKLKTDFEWKETKSGRVIAFKNGKTSGASIGLTFGGNINQDKGTMDISGTFVPMSEINGFVSKIPLIGGLLTGGKGGGVIAATYAMTGKSDDPNVFINPLSVLTPGFLRSILFENNTTIFDDGGDDEVVNRPAKKGYNN